MAEGLYTRNPPRDKDPGEQKDKAPRVHANKLKNKDSASKYYGQKLRTGKADNSETIEEKNHREKLRKQTQKKASEVEKVRKSQEAAKKERTVSKSSASVSESASRVAAAADIMSDVVNSSEDNRGESAVSEEVFEAGG